MVGLEFADASGANGTVIGLIHGFHRHNLIADHTAEGAVCVEVGLQNAGFFCLGFFFQAKAGFFFLPRQILGTDALVDLCHFAFCTLHLAIRGGEDPLMVIEGIAAYGTSVIAGAENDLRIMAAFEAATGTGGIFTEIIPFVADDLA